MPVQIHGKQYITVSERVEMANKDFIGLNTEVLETQPVVVIKATVTTKKGTFTGISAANPAKLIEKQNPYEVAETSAVGRALGFAGYGILEGIASADEIVKATKQNGSSATSSGKNCEIHNVDMKTYKNISTGEMQTKHMMPLEKRADGTVAKWDSCFGKGWESDERNEEPDLDF